VAKRASRNSSEVSGAAGRIFAANQQMNQMLIENLDASVWTAKPPGNVRTIAAIFAHMHNVRCKWIRLTAPYLKVPAQIKRGECTPERAQEGLAQSAAGCIAMLDEAFGGGESRIKTFRRDGWAQPWPVGPEMLCYMVAHEAHHRGQVCMVAHQLGFKLPNKVTSAMWSWETLLKKNGAVGL
jgi:uncharacterized damage-inducible protein DinB